jgi:AbrB family looped-hinge helix DNA binding protein
MGDHVKHWTRTVDRYGRVIIPAELRKKLGLTPGTRVRFELKDGVIYLTRLRRGVRHE